MSRRALWWAGLALALALGVGACGSLPTIAPDLARQPRSPVQLEGARGPLTAAQSKAVLDRLKSSGKETDLLERQ